MIGNIKTPTRALVAVLALAAAAAPAAQAAGMDFTAESYPTTVAGLPTTVADFTVQGQKIECVEASFGGGLVEQSSRMDLPTVVYSGCSAFGGVEAEVRMNGCEYTFTLEGTDPKETGNPDEGVGSVDVLCPPSKEITITALSCTVHIPAQATIPGGLTFEANTGLHNLTVDANVTGIHSKVTSGFLCPFTEKLSDSSGTYTGTTVVQSLGKLGMAMT